MVCPYNLFAVELDLRGISWLLKVSDMIDSRKDFQIYLREMRAQEMIIIEA